MMESVNLDPYEQQLLAVFNRYDYDKIGSLDETGLTELCHTLQLQEQGAELIRSLLNEPQKSRVKFIEFKDALLMLLGNMQKKHVSSEENETKGSPEREVSPKYIYGSKKYGRRSRPKTDFNLDEQNDLNYLNKKENSVQRSNSEVCNSKKRKTNFKLKRCTSLPSREDQNPPNPSEFPEENELICTEDMLRKAWKSLGVGEDGYLNQTELFLVCDAIGLHNLAGAVLRHLSDKINLDYDKISFQQLLEALKHDETWTDLLNASESTICNESSLAVHTSDTSFPDSQTFQFISLGPDGNGIISTDAVIDMWEAVGITAPKELLHELGFNSRQIKITELAAVLESGLKALNENENAYTNPHISLLQANLTLYQSEIKCLRTIMEQLNAERDKLKYDITEANNRATLLAQEVDDNHQKMQENTQNQVKLLEQRHNEILKNLTKQFGEEKEELNHINVTLEQKIMNLEQETAKLKNDLTTAKKYLSTIEVENNQLNCRVTDLNQTKNMLQEQVIILENECQKYSELEHDKIKPLLEKLSRLELENCQLRDQSDEMGAEIESLNSQISILRGKATSSPVNTLDRSMENNFSMFCEGNSYGAKRRSDDSPSKDLSLYNSNLSLSSPRLGKIRKLPKNSEIPTSSESGFSTEVEYGDSSFDLSSISNGREIKRLQAKIVFLEQILHQNDIAIPSDDDLETVWTNVNNVAELKSRVSCLESIINEIKEEFQKFDAKDTDTKLMIEKLSKMIVQDDLLGGKIYEMRAKNELELDKKVYSDASTTTEPDTDLEANINKLEEQNKELNEKCSDLEKCIDLLRTEYEKCEDYWSSKLDEERQIFEQEQCQSNEKFAELFNKMSEYEEQFSDQNDMRLPPIAETYNLEKQFTDLEEEYDNFKVEMETLVCTKDEEIAFLKQKLTELALEKEKKRDATVQVDELNEYKIVTAKMMQLSHHVVECTNFNVNWTSDSSQENKTTQETAQQIAENNLNWSNFPSTSSSSTEKSSSAPCRPKRTRKHERDAHQYKKCSRENLDEARKEHTIPALMNSIQNLNARRVHLEQRCRQLQVVVQEQHHHIERTLQQCWQNQQSERIEHQAMLKMTQDKLDYYARGYKEMTEKLMKTDVLVKELYVENSYLLANVQRLEQERHILAQCNTNNSL